MQPKITYFTPGPSQLYPTVPAHIHKAIETGVLSISHRSKAFMEIYDFAVSGLRTLFGLPDDWQVFFHSAATEIWERLIQNCVTDSSFHFVNGSFSSRFFQIAAELGRNPVKAEATWGEGFAKNSFEVPQTTELIAFTHNETSTGVSTPLSFVYPFRESHSEALLTIDMVSSAPDPELDFGKLDACYFSVQKCFGLPAGLGVLLLGPRCLSRAEGIVASGRSTGSYHSFASQLEKAVKNQTPETPNVLNIYLLGRVVNDMLEKGVDAIRSETIRKAEMLYGFLENSQRMRPFVKDPALRSRTVIVAEVDGGSRPLLDTLAAQGMLPGDGYGKMKGQQIRIANFPAISISQMERLMGAMEAWDKKQ
jgi:phosphoserine aminotransferase